MNLLQSKDQRARSTLWTILLAGGLGLERRMRLSRKRVTICHPADRIKWGRLRRSADISADQNANVPRVLSTRSNIGSWNHKQFWIGKAILFFARVGWKSNAAIRWSKICSAARRFICKKKIITGQLLWNLFASNVPLGNHYGYQPNAQFAVSNWSDILSSSDKSCELSPSQPQY